MGSVREYQSRFEQLLAKVGHLTPTRQVSCFVSGLKENIKADVLAGRPTDLTSAIGLARLYDARNASQRKIIQPNNTSSQVTAPVGTDQPDSRSPSTVRRMSQAELKERREKGLCYNCNEKFVPGHRCKKLFLIEACNEVGDGDVVMDVESFGGADNSEISLHVISGINSSKTMRVQGQIGNTFPIVLLDSGSTHNFISECLAIKLMLQSDLGQHVKVKLASGEKLVSRGRCTGVSIKLSNFFTKADFYILPLDGYEVVMGTQWLCTLGEIIWDFSKLIMRFVYDGREITLQGVSVDSKKISAMLNWSQPRTSKAMRNFHGLTRYCHQIIKGYNKIAAPLTQMLRKSLFSCILVAKSISQQLKEAMTTALVWAFPNFNQVFIIECDISRSRIVAVLRQKQLIASHSHTLHGKKLLLSTYEKEMLALIMAVQKWRHYLLGRRFIVRMNHRNLIKMDPNRFPERWLYKLIGFNFTIQHKLAPQSYGPFQILQGIGKVACKLNFLGKSRIHPVFHASLLKGKLGANALAQSQLLVVHNSQTILDQRQQ